MDITQEFQALAHQERMSSSSENKDEISLSDVGVGVRCIVTQVEASLPGLKHKLLTMGIVEGTAIEITSIAPLGDPITVRAIGYSLSLRKTEAAGITVVRV